jgi:RNA polymerase sigma-70 factor (ECF subfamily)
MAPDPQQLAALLAASGRRDRAAFEQLYRATSPKLFGVAVRILRREDWAEEVLQDCYVSIWHHAQDYTPGLAQPMTWMTSIVRNRCLDRLRKPALETPDEDQAIADATEGDVAGPLEALERAGEAAAVKRCLDGLEPKQRQTIALAFFEGLSHTEIAGHLREPLGSVKTWVRRGLARLKTCMDGA